MRKKRRLQRSDAIWLCAVGLLVLLQFWWLPGDPGTPDDTYSNTIEGKRGFFQTLESLSQAGVLPKVERESTQLVPERPCTLVILSPDRYPDDNEKEELAEFVMNGGSVVFAPNWESPEFSLPALRIYLKSKYFGDEDTVYSGGPTRVPVSPGNTPPVAVPPGEMSAEQGDLTPEAPDEGAEAPDEGAEAPDEGAEAPDEGAEASAEVPVPQISRENSVPPVRPQLGNPPPDPGSSEDPADNRVGPPGMPPQNPTIVDRTNPNLMPVSDFNTESQLVAGAIPWRTRASMTTYGQSPTVLVRSASGTVQAASWRHGSGLVLLSASSDVFSNRAMLHPGQAELAVRLIEHAHTHHEQNYGAAAGPIVVSEYLNASDAYTGTGVLMSPALRSGTLQLITIALLAGWFGFHRFGPPGKTFEGQRRSLTESAIAVGNLHYRTSSGSEAVRSYLEYVKSQLQKLIGRSVGLADIARISARSGLSEDDVGMRLRLARDLAGQQGTPAQEAAAAVRGLSEILDRLHGNRTDE